MYLTTCLSRFVDWFVCLENGEESFGLDKHPGLFTHLILPPLDANMDTGHTVSLHCGYLYTMKNRTMDVSLALNNHSLALLTVV
jgi:hypothetical protein